MSGTAFAADAPGMGGAVQEPGVARRARACAASSRPMAAGPNMRRGAFADCNPGIPSI